MEGTIIYIFCILLVISKPLLLFFWIKPYYKFGLKINKSQCYSSNFKFDYLKIVKQINKTKKPYFHDLVLNSFEDNTFGIREEIKMRLIKKFNESYYTPILRCLISFNQEESYLEKTLIIGIHDLFFIVILILSNIGLIVLAIFQFIEDPVFIIFPFLFFGISFGLIYYIITHQIKRYNEVFKRICSISWDDN